MLSRRSTETGTDLRREAPVARYRPLLATGRSATSRHQTTDYEALYRELLDRLAAAERRRHELIRRYIGRTRPVGPDDPIHEEWSAADEAVTRARQSIRYFVADFKDALHV